jgi:hypothetical protein
MKRRIHRAFITAAIVVGMAMDKDTPTAQQKRDPTRRRHILRVVVVVLLVSLIAVSVALSLAVFVFVPIDIEDNTASLWGIRIGAVLVAIGALWCLIRIGYGYEWTGLGEAKLPKQENVEFRPKKTLWDWLQLLIVPFVVTVIGISFTLLQDMRQQAIERDRAQEAALQAYLDQMSVLVLHENLSDDQVQAILWARTLTVLERVGPSHKTQVLQFLSEANLVQSVDGTEPVIALDGAALGADEPDPGVGVLLDDIELSGASLSRATLTRANLENADLRDADLRDANLYEVDLRGADLSRADVRQRQLRQAKSLEGVTMPNGQKYEAWLKSQAHEENGKGGGSS